MGAPIGNDNASKSRVVHDELRKLAVQDDYRRLRKGLERVMDAFENGEPWAAQFVRDSLDGKPAQAISFAPDDKPAITMIRMLVVSSDDAVRPAIEHDPNA